MKRGLFYIALSFLVLTYLVHVLDYFTFKAIQWYFIREAKQLVKTTKEEELTMLFISFHDISKGEVRWNKRDEIVYRGKWYDIKSVKFIANGVLIYAYEDKVEKALVDNYFKRLLSSQNTVAVAFLQWLSLKLYVLPSENITRVAIYTRLIVYPFVVEKESTGRTGKLIKPPTEG